MPVMIQMRTNGLGAEFSFHPFSQLLLNRWFPHAQRMHSISITMDGLDYQNGSFWDRLVQLLTGLTESQLEDIGG